MDSKRIRQINNHLKNIKTGDLISLVAAISFVILLLYLDFDSQAKPEIVEVRNGSSIWLYPLNSDIIFQPLDDNGTCVIEIKENKASVTSSACPLKICISMGEIEKLNQWIACLPHQIFISIIGKTNNHQEMDAIVF